MGIPDLDLVNVLDSNSSSNEEVLVSSTPIASHSHNAINKTSSQPISKWNLKFTGENKPGDLSLSAFLERVEVTRIARSVSNQDLFNSGIDLFSGKALVWYRTVRKQVRHWPALVALLREEF